MIGNGDVRSGADAVAMLAQTGCDAVMIGRAALGNPAVFTECQAALANELSCSPSGRQSAPGSATVTDLCAVALRHLQMMLVLKGSRRGPIEMRKHAAWYLSGQRGAARLRDEIMRADDPAAVAACLRTALMGAGG